MKESVQRVQAVIRGETPDRPPLFDLLRNDEVIEHYAGIHPTPENASEVVYRAYEPAIDATRESVRLPAHDNEVLLEDGRRMKCYRWTNWKEPKIYPDTETYVAEKRAHMESTDPTAWSDWREKELQAALDHTVSERNKLGEVFFFPSLAGPNLMHIYGQIGIEQYSYIQADCPEIIVEQLEFNTQHAVSLASHYPEGHQIEAGFLGDDIAFKSGPLFRPDWLREQYFPRLARVIAAWHEKGIRVLFHSDGNLNPVLDDLVEAGIDGLNPIEILAGMDVGTIHARHPHLFLAGGIDVSQLLPFGHPRQVARVVRQAIEQAEGRLMVGSSTELNNEVPLENFRAMRETVLGYSY